MGLKTGGSTSAGAMGLKDRRSHKCWGAETAARRPAVVEGLGHMCYDFKDLRSVN
jgi:hypothetical protein